MEGVGILLQFLVDLTPNSDVLAPARTTVGSKYSPGHRNEVHGRFGDGRTFCGFGEQSKMVDIF